MKISIKEISNQKDIDLNKLNKICFERYYNYVAINNDIENIDEKYKNFIKLCINKYYDEKLKTPFTKYIYVKLKRATKYKNFDTLDNDNNIVQTLIVSAKSNDKDAKNELIKRYMYIIEKYISQIKTKLDKEDALQIGYLFLIDKINNYIDNDVNVDLSQYLITSVNKILSEKIRNFDINESKYQDEKENIQYIPDSFIENLQLLELSDYIESSDGIKNNDKIIYSGILYGKTQSEIADELNVSSQYINQRVIRNRVKIKRFYKMQ